MPMPITVHQTEIADVLQFEAGIIRDARGYFTELYSRTQLELHGFRENFVQDNLSLSKRGTLRGLHYQLMPHGMGKLVRVLQGRVFDVAVDLRRSSQSYGRWVGRELDAERGMALWVPIGFAHGFIALEDDTLVMYKCTTRHEPAAERIVHWNDARIGVRWPIEPTLIADKDAAAPPLERAEHNFE